MHITMSGWYNKKVKHLLEDSAMLCWVDVDAFDERNGDVIYAMTPMRTFQGLLALPRVGWPDWWSSVIIHGGRQ